MKASPLFVLTPIALTALGITASRHAAAQEPRPTIVDNPHHLIDLGQFVKIPAVRTELALTDDQIALVNVHAEGLNQRMEEYCQRIGQVEDRRASYLRFREEEALIRRLTDGVFATDQLTRLKQLASQHVTRKPLASFGLLTPTMKQELRITDEQAQTLHEKSATMAEQLQRREAEMALELEKLRSKMSAEVESLRAKMRAELVDSLKPEQRESVNRIWGELIPIPQ